MKKLIILAALASLAGFAPASAHAPNDHPEDATLITSLPFTDQVHMASEASPDEAGTMRGLDSFGTCIDTWAGWSVNPSAPLSRVNTVWYRYYAEGDHVLHATSSRIGQYGSGSDSDHGFGVTRTRDGATTQVGCTHATDDSSFEAPPDFNKADMKIPVLAGDELLFRVYGVDNSDGLLTFLVREAAVTDFEVTKVATAPLVDTVIGLQQPGSIKVTATIRADTDADARRQILVDICNASDCWYFWESTIKPVQREEVYLFEVTPLGCLGTMMFVISVIDPYGVDPVATNSFRFARGTVIADPTPGRCIGDPSGRTPPPAWAESP